MKNWLLIFTLSVVAAGCNTPPVQTENKPTPAPAESGNAAAPEATGEAPARSMAKDKELYETAKADYEADKASEEKKKQYIQATMNYGEAAQYTDTLPPKEKYPLALDLFREVLKVDPKNEEAKKYMDTIVDIYKQMGRPVPGA